VVGGYDLIVDLEVDVLDREGDLEVLFKLLFGCVRNGVLLRRGPSLAWRGLLVWCFGSYVCR